MDQAYSVLLAQCFVPVVGVMGAEHEEGHG